MSEITSVSSTTPLSHASSNWTHAHQERPTHPESAAHEAEESPAETRAEAESGDRQAMRKWEAAQASTPSPAREPSPAVPGRLDLQA